MRIGVFDSGIGGITVLSELKKRFPGAEFVYFGDTANVPYGTKSAAQVERLAVACAKTLKGKGIDALVVACNTASSLALPAVREVMLPLPVFGVVDPGVDAALEALATFDAQGLTAPILVLATRATIKSQAYAKTLRKVLDPKLTPGRVPLPIIEQACPLLVPMIEEGWLNHPILHQTISEYVTPHAKSQDAGIALLACTHYPWIISAFEKALPGWKVVNSARAVADAMTRAGITAPGKSDVVEWFFSDPDSLPEFAKELTAKSDLEWPGD